MKATLYETLGIAQTASDDEIRAALRRLIRHYYARSRGGRGGVEEALRFVNYASRVLANPELRQRYDRELAASGGGDTGLPTGLELPSAPSRTAAAATPTATVEEAREARPTGAEPPTRRSTVSGSNVANRPRGAQTGLAQTVGNFERSRYSRTVLSVAMLSFAVVVAWLSVPPEDLAGFVRNALVSMTAVLVVAALVYGVVYLVRGRRRPVAPPLPPQTDMAVANWRRQTTVFLGSEKPAEDAGWVFQLRLAELERAQARRTGEPRPGRRLAARLIDYCLWATLLTLGGRAVIGLGGFGSAGGVLDWAFNPLIAPVVITGSWVPIEALLGTTFGTTPGKWLMSVYLQFAISDAYAQREGARFARWLARAARVWANGIAFGFPLVAPFAMAACAQSLRRQQETPWDYRADCLVTQGALAWPAAVSGMAVLGASAWFHAAIWAAPIADGVAGAASRFEAVANLAGGAAGVGERAPAAITEWRDKLTAMVPRWDAEPARSQRAVPADGSGAPRTVAATARDAGAASRRQDAPAVGAGDPGTAVVATAQRARASGGAESPRELDTAAAVDQRERSIAAAREARRGLRENPVRALKVCEDWSRLEPSSGEAWQCYGRSLAAAGRHREAILALRRALSISPGDEIAKATLARSEEAMFMDFRARYGATER